MSSRLSGKNLPYLLAVMMAALFASLSSFAVEPSKQLSPLAQMFWDQFMRTDPVYVDEQLGYSEHLAEDISRVFDTPFMGSYNENLGYKVEVYKNAMKEFMDEPEVRRRLAEVKSLKKNSKLLKANEQKFRALQSEIEENLGLDLHPEKRLYAVIESWLRKQQKLLPLSEKEAEAKARHTMASLYPGLTDYESDYQLRDEFQRLIQRYRLEEALKKSKADPAQRKKLLLDLLTEVRRIRAKDLIQANEASKKIFGYTTNLDSHFAYEETTEQMEASLNTEAHIRTAFGSPQLKRLKELNADGKMILFSDPKSLALRARTSDGKEYTVVNIFDGADKHLFMPGEKIEFVRNTQYSADIIEIMGLKWAEKIKTSKMLDYAEVIGANGLISDHPIYTSRQLELLIERMLDTKTTGNNENFASYVFSHLERHVKELDELKLEKYNESIFGTFKPQSVTPEYLALNPEIAILSESHSVFQDLVVYERLKHPEEFIKRIQPSDEKPFLLGRLEHYVKSEASFLKYKGSPPPETFLQRMTERARRIWGVSEPIIPNGKMPSAIELAIPKSKPFNKATPGKLELFKVKGLNGKSTVFYTAPPEVVGKGHVVLLANAPLSKPAFAIETSIGMNSNGRALSIPTPINYEPAFIELRSASGEVLRAGEDYVLVKPELYPGYLLKLVSKKAKSGGPFSMNVQYRPSTENIIVAKRPSVFQNLDLVKLAQESTKLREAGFTALSDALDKRITVAEASKHAISAEELSEIFANTAHYSFHPAAAVSGTNLKNPYLKYAQFLNSTGEFCAQCDGGSSLYDDVVTAILADTKTHSVHSVTGYVYDGKGAVVLGDAHAQNMLAELKRPVAIVDATPAFQTESKLAGASATGSAAKNDLISAHKLYLKDLKTAQEEFRATWKSLISKVVDRSEPAVKLDRLTRLVQDLEAGTLSLTQARGEFLDLYPGAVKEYADAEALLEAISIQAKHELEIIEKFVKKTGNKPTGRYAHYSDEFFRKRLTTVGNLLAEAPQKLKDKIVSKDCVPHEIISTINTLVQEAALEL